MELPTEFVEFLWRAKRATYASGVQPVAGSRPAAHDLPYREGAWSYLDSYLGGHSFAGEEAVWQEALPVWGMNYYGWMETEEFPAGFSDFLKRALMAAPVEAPLRGPEHLRAGEYAYFCAWQGDLSRFQGQERIERNGVCLYRLVFHGGGLRA